MMPSRALVVLRAIRSPSGTEMTTRTPLCAQVDGLADGLGDHRAGHRVDRGAAQLEAEARLGDHPDAHAAVQLEAGLVAPAHGGGQPRAVGDVGVVAGVLDHDRLGSWPRCQGAFVHRETDPVAVGQADSDGVLDLPGIQRGGGRLGGGGRAGPGGPAGAQRLLPDLRRPRQVGLAQLGIVPLCHGPSRSAGRRGRAEFLPGLPVRPGGTRGNGPDGTGASGCPPAARRRADQHQRVLPELALLHGGGQVVQGAVHDQLVRPGHLVGDHARGVRRVAAAEQFVLQLAGPRGREEQRHRGAVPGELGDPLPRRHRRLAAAEPGQDHRLGHLRDGQLAADPRGHRGEAGHPGHDLGVQARARRTARAAPGSAPHSEGSPEWTRATVQFLLAPRARSRAARPPSAARPSRRSRRRARACSSTSGCDQAGRPDHHVGGGDGVRAAQVSRSGAPGPGSHEDHPPHRLVPSPAAVARRVLARRPSWPARRHWPARRWPVAVLTRRWPSAARRRRGRGGIRPGGCLSGASGGAAGGIAASRARG